MLFKALITFLFICSCTQKKPELKKNELNIPISSNLDTLDPAVAFDQVSLNVLYQIYETLYEYEYGSKETKIIPLLAEKLPEISEDLLTYTIKIKKNVKYHSHKLLKPQRTVKAQDFVNQIKRLTYVPTRSQGFWLFDGKVEGINKFKKEAKDLKIFLKMNISGLKAIDDYTLQIKLTKPYPQIMYALAMAFVTPIPTELIEPLENNLNNETFGTGPFTLKTFKRSHLIELEKFNDYHVSSLPKLNMIKMPFMKEAQTRWLNFRKGNIDFFGLGKDHHTLALDKEGKLRPELKQENTNLYKQNSLTYWWLAFNMQDELMSKNLNLRKAIAHSINWDKYIEIFTLNTSSKANSIYHPSLDNYEFEDKNLYPYNPEEAMNYLKLAGFEDGKNLPTINFDTRSTSKTSKQSAEFIKSELKKIGINIKVTTNNFPAFLKKAREGKLQLWQDGWGLDYPDPENVLQLLITKNHPPGVNATYYSSNLIDEGFEKLYTASRGEKKEVLKEVEKKLKEDYVWIMQHYPRNFILYNKDIKNYRPTALNSNFFKHLSL